MPPKVCHVVRRPIAPTTRIRQLQAWQHTRVARAVRPVQSGSSIIVAQTPLLGIRRHWDTGAMQGLLSVNIGVVLRCEWASVWRFAAFQNLWESKGDGPTHTISDLPNHAWKYDCEQHVARSRFSSSNAMARSGKGHLQGFGIGQVKSLPCKSTSLVRALITLEFVVSCSHQPQAQDSGSLKFIRNREAERTLKGSLVAVGSRPSLASQQKRRGRGTRRPPRASRVLTSLISSDSGT